MLIHPVIGTLFFFADMHDLVERFEQTMMSAIIALERVNRAGKVREALQVLTVFEVAAAHGRRKAQRFRVLVGAEQRDRVVETVHHILEHALRP